MKVVKRNGMEEQVSFNKVTLRLEKLCTKTPELDNIDFIHIAQKVIGQIYNGVNTNQLDELAAEICTSNITVHPNYGILASRIIISNNQKSTSPSFSECISELYNNTDKYTDEKNPLVSTRIFEITQNNKDKLNSSIDYNRDFLIDYFGYKTLEKSYLFKINDKVVERIQHMYMRVALGIHLEDIKNVIKTYDYMSQKYFIHATPTLFHSGTENPQLLSCFLLGMEDSVDGIYKTIGDCAKISKWAGGIGLHLHDIRSNNSLIKSTNGNSNGIMPLLKVLNDTAKHINQSGRRNGSFAIYLELWHSDIHEFLEAKKNHGDETDRARDLFYGLWVNDLFMKRVENDEEWSLFCPDKCRKLTDTYGTEFEKLYINYEKNDKLVMNKIKARKLWEQILISQIETGTPYLLYKDSCNKKSNQQNLGTIRSSNLCTEIIEYSSSTEYACCTLASIGLPKFVKKYDKDNIINITVYSKKNCKYCDYSKNYLKYNKINYTEKEFNKTNIDELDDKLDTFEAISYPQIFVTLKNNTDEKHIGGFNELISFFKPEFDFIELYNVAKVITLNLNRIIDNNYYPVPETRYSNKLHRPIGIGIQGLADVYSMFNLSFDSPESVMLNKQIFATIYYASTEASMEISKTRLPDMKLIKRARNAYGPGPGPSGNNSPIHKANEYSKLNDIYVWKRGDIGSINFDNLQDTHLLSENKNWDIVKKNLADYTINYYL